MHISEHVMASSMEAVWAEAKVNNHTSTRIVPDLLPKGRVQ